MLALSLALTILAILTLFLLVPPLILLPLACFFGYKFFKASRLKHPQRSLPRTLLALVPMVLPVVVFVFFFYAYTTQYNV
jgi:hypothetical protein